MIALFRALPIIWQIVSGVAVFGAVVGGYAYWHHKVYTAGYDAAISAVAHENQEALNVVTVLKAKRRDCVARGATWDQSRGLCQ